MAADPASFDELIHAAGREWNVDPRLLKAVMMQESGGNPDARSKAGARGLMQIMPDTAKGLGLTNPHDPAQSIFGGAKYLSEALDKEGSPEAALLYYHGGPDWRSKYGAESRGYVPGVTAHYTKIAAPGPAAPSKEGNPMPAPAKSKADEADPDFLAQTGARKPGTAAVKGNDPDPDFLAQTGAQAPTPTPDAAQTTDDEIADLVMPGGGSNPATALRQIGEALPSKDTVLGIGNRLASAAVEGYQNTPPAITPLGRSVIEGAGPIGRYITSPVLQAAGGAMGVLGGIGGALSQGAVEVGNALGQPSLGRDINMLAQVSPFARMGAGVPRLPGERPPGPAYRTAQEHFGESTPGDPFGPLRAPDAAFIPPTSDIRRPVAGGEAANLLRADGRPSFVPPNEPGPGTPTMTITAPRPGLSEADNAWVSSTAKDVREVMKANADLGIPADLSAAATPAQLAQLTPAQMKAYRRMAELRDVLRPIEPDDNTIYVPGSIPTLAERAGNPKISQAETVLRQRNPEEFAKKLGPARDGRINYFDEMSGTDVQRASLNEARIEAAKRDNARITATAKPADLTPALEKIDALLGDVRLKETPEVAATFKPLRDALFDADGKLKTDPQSVWGMHDNLIHRLNNAKFDRGSPEAKTNAQLVDFKKTIDEVMNTATDGKFQEYLDTQSNYHKQLNAMELLQNFRPRFTNAKGDINAPAFHRFVTDLAVRRGKPGIDPAMDIPDQTMAGLIAIDTDLKRAGNIDIGKARGSPTNLYFEVANALGIAGAHVLAAAASAGPGVGNLLVGPAVEKAKSMVSGINLRRQTRKYMADPPEGYRQAPNLLNQDAP